MNSLTRIVLPFVVLLLFGLTSIAQAYTVSGTITNGTSQTGRLYVMLVNSDGNSTGFGTSIAGITASQANIPYSIRGVTPGTYKVRAFLDPRDNTAAAGHPYGASPFGSSNSFVITTSNYTVPLFSVATPTTVPAAGDWWTGKNVNAVPITAGSPTIYQAAMVFWDLPKFNVVGGDPSTYTEIAESYTLCWGTNSVPTPTTHTGGACTPLIPSVDDGHQVVSGLVQGTSYYFNVIATLGATTANQVSALTTIAAPAGGYTVTARVVFPSNPPAAGMLVGLMSDTGGYGYLYAITDTTQRSIELQINHVQNGTYRLFALLDLNNDKRFSLGDVNADDGDFHTTMVTVNGANVTAPTVLIKPSSDLRGDVTTEVQRIEPNTNYFLQFRADQQIKRPAHIVIEPGPGIAETIDMGLTTWGNFNLTQSVATQPQVGNSYMATVTYTDNTTSDPISLAVSGVVPTPPSQNYPVGATSGANSTSPRFAWNPDLSSMPAGPYGYYLQLKLASSPYGDPLWETGQSADRLSVAYTGSALSNGTTYLWGLYMVDAFGNRASRWSQFTPNSAGSLSISSVSPSSIACSAVSRTITINGSGFIDGESSNMIYFNNGSAVAATYQNSDQLIVDLPECSTNMPNPGPLKVVAGGNSAASTTEFVPTVDYKFYVSDMSTTPVYLSGASVSVIGRPEIPATTTNASGYFDLAGIPTGIPYALRITASGYDTVDSAFYLNYADSIAASNLNRFSLPTTGQIQSLYGNTSGKGLIRSRVINESTGAYVTGAVVSAYSYLYKTPLTVSYGLTCSTGSTTDDTGMFCVKDVEPGDHVMITASKAAYSLTKSRMYAGFANEMGQTSVRMTDQFPIAVAGAAMLFSYDGSNYLVGVENHATTPTSIAAQLISPTGEKVGGLITTGRNGIATNSAFDGTNHLLIWEDDPGGSSDARFSIYGQFISKAGTKVGVPFDISGSSVWFDGMKTMAFGGGNYLVTYTRLVGGDPNNRYIAGRLVAPDGTVGSEFRISTGNGDASDVAFDGTNFFVVWTEDSADTEIRGKFVSTSGVPGTEISVNASTAPSDNPKTVAFDGTNYLVVWNDEVSGAGTYTWDVFGQRIDKSGNKVGGVITITNEANPQMPTSVAFDGVNYLATWVDMSNPIDWNLFGQYITTSGALSGSKFAISTASTNQVGGVGFANGKFLALINNGVSMVNGGITSVEGTYGRFITPASLPSNAPTVSSLSTSSGSVGSEVTITGAYFVNGATTVSFNGTISTSITFVSSAEIRVTVPGGASTGPVTVTTAAGTATNQPTFTVVPPTRTLTVSLSGVGSGTVTSTAGISPALNCPGVSCTADVAYGASVTLLATPSATSSFGGWSGACTSVPCTFSMTDNLTAIATFTLKPLLNYSLTRYYDTLLEALTDANSGNEVRAHDSLQAPSLSYNRANVTVKIAGGYDNAFTSRNLPSTTYTDITSPLTIQAGTLILDQIIVK
ncbi:IPT/TIG domain-containing protein [Trichlorobacter lovleyi]|uniref:carboxypeptidase-like regulatory domain-containing protein n=1 Tax=Trichlorobacter lovleyi TaxID=313985 RepID=UPI00223EE524|nr:carboxypeptidase-like regulatory domain-containing protein [Trichlorobacter lovleyi]QOX78505.1 IPT/TIG domain-containing protein [Trichlorobacter lovleyi]